MKQIELKLNLPNEKEFDKIKTVVYELDIPDGYMVNNQQMFPRNMKIHFKVEGKQLKVTYRYNSHYASIDDVVFTFTGNVIPIQPRLQKDLSYHEEIESVVITAPLKYVYQWYKDHQMDLNPIYQRDMVWTQEQKEHYLINLFESRARIEPTIVQYYDDVNNEVYEVLDGKQRLTTLFDFIDNKITVKGLYFKDLHNDDQNFLMNFNVQYKRIIKKRDFGNLDINTKLQLFYEINLYGTKMSDKDLQRVQSLMTDSMK